MSEQKEVLPVVVLPVEVEELALRVSETKKAEVNTVLNQIFAGTSDWKKQAEAIEIKGISDTMSIQLAEAGRKNVKNARLNAEKIFDAKRDEVQQIKSEYDLEDKLWLKAKQTAVILFKDIETTFEWKANFVKRYEAEQKELRTQLRIEKVAKYNPDINRINFENMTDEMFNIFISGMEKEHNDRIKAEQEAEAERLRLIEVEKENARLKAIEDERIRLENERLKVEAEKRERAIEAERKKQAEILAKQKADAEALAEAERKKQAEILAKERAEAEARQRAIEEEARKAAALAEAERKRLQAEIASKEAVEAAAKVESERKERERLEAEKKAAKAPDKTKLLKWVNEVSMPELKLGTPEGIGVAQTIDEKFAAFKRWAQNLIETL